MSAAERLERIVALVAELSRRPEGDRGTSFAELAARFDTTKVQIAADIRTLTLLGEDSDSAWLLSLSVTQEKDRLSIRSGGPYRRPLRFTPEEMLAMQVALVEEGDRGRRLARALAAAGTDAAQDGGAREPPVFLAGAPAEGGVRELARQAAAANRKLVLDYAGEGTTEPSSRVVQPHQLVTFEGATYVVAWCERARGWRRFRTDRVVAATLASETFAPREDFAAVERPDEIFEASEEDVDRVEVRFSPAIARWIAERYPETRAHPDGSVTVTFRATSAEWLVRQVLQYGPEAEVMTPDDYREAVRRAVAS